MRCKQRQRSREAKINVADRIQQHADRGDQKVAYTRTSEIRSAGFSGWRWGDRELMVTDSFFVAKKWHLLKPYTVSGKPIRRCDEEEGLGMWYMAHSSPLSQASC